VPILRGHRATCAIGARTLWLLLDMRSIVRAALAAALLLASTETAPAQETAPEPPLRIFFITDVHSRHGHMERFVERANRDRPDLILDGGDFVHDGTESEFRRAYADRARLLSSWYVVKGNHDAERRGPFTAPPPAFPEFRTVDHGGVRFFLLDNHREVLTEAQFERLERELAAGAGRRMVVVMHVPPLVRREAPLVRLRHLLPFPLASPVMRDPEQVRRFTELVERHGVLAVLTGHTHAHDQQVRGGVHYVVAGAVGGLTPGLGIPNEFVEIVIDDRDVQVRRIEIARPPGDPVTFVSRAFRFYADLNGFNHAAQGWNYVPSASVQYRAGARTTEAKSRDEAAAWGAVSFERQLGPLGRHAFFGDLGASAGRTKLAAHVAAGYKVRPLGDFNRNLYLAAAATASGGMLARQPTAGIGAQIGLGVEWRSLTLEMNRNVATNHRSAGVTLGRRF
jgi:predicted phosphodiesterase